MNYYNLPHELDLIIKRFKVKTKADGYLTLATKISSLKPTIWYSTITQIKETILYINMYQIETTDGDLQDIIDTFTSVTWYNFLKNIERVKKAVELIETL